MSAPPLSPLARLLRRTLRRDPCTWARACGVELRPYQRRIALAVKRSVLEGAGLTFVVILPRQSGKNEVQAHLFAWLLFRYSQAGGRIVSVSPTFRPQVLNAMQRVRASLDACPGSRGRWKTSGGSMFHLGRACLQFLSGQPGARVVGATADLLLSVDEAQDIAPPKFDRDFDPMTASTNATRIFWGTAWTSDTLLERQRQACLGEEKTDGRRRVFFYTAEQVCRCVPAYGRHLERVIREKGRNHPLVRTQYFCETLDAQAGLFNAARLALIFGHNAGANVQPGQPCAFLIDVAGQDEARLAAGQDSCGLANPGRDLTTLSIAGIDLTTLESLGRPAYQILERHAWHGQDHLSVFGQIRALAGRWQPLQFVLDAGGVGEGLWSLLEQAFPGRVLPVKFSSHTKSEIGWRFLAIIETGRFQVLAADENVRLQYQHCQGEILPGPLRTLRWGVPQGRRGPAGELIHDDALLADALVAVLDRLDWRPASRATFLPPASDPLREMERNY